MKRATLLLGLVFCLTGLYANNVQISSVNLVEKDTVNKVITIAFDITWENSWRTSSAPYNHDAAWIFMKFKNAAGEWHHATLSTDSLDYSPASGTVISPVSDGKGFFLYRSQEGNGSFVSNGNRIKWYYASDGFGNTDPVEIKLFAIEMVYIPSGAFYVGSSSSSNGDVNFLRKITGTDTSAFLVDTALVDSVTSEGTGISDSQDDDVLKGINGYSGIGVDGDNGLDSDNDGVIDNPDFPTGYRAFYLMKYEISQIQYVEFLNTLTRTQQISRTAIQDSGYYAMTGDSVVVDRNGIRVASAPASGPFVFGCDLNRNGVMNETSDGTAIAANYMSWQDIAAYLDWSALRPYTELEFEKAARGPETPLTGAFVWGDLSAETENYKGLDNAGTESEIVSNPLANVHASPQGVGGPIRVGSFAQSGTSRSQAGAGYYGNLDLGGNLWEIVISIGNSVGRGFTGSHGDGELDANGDANVSGWPPVNTTVKLGKRGAPYVGSTNEAKIANRNYSNRSFYQGQRRYFDGCRGAHSAY